MMTVIYGTLLFVAIVVLIYLAQKDQDNIDIYQWSMLLIMSVVITAYWLRSQVETADGAYILQCFAYFDSTYLFCVVILYLLHIIGVRAWPWVKIVLYGLASLHELIILFCYHTGFFALDIQRIICRIGHIMLRIFPPSSRGIVILWPPSFICPIPICEVNSTPTCKIRI